MDIAESFRRAVRYVMRDTLYLAHYSATVERQHSDDSLDLMPDDVRVRGTGLSRVPIRHGLPGVRVLVVNGSRVLLGFENGDPSKPYASCWSASSIEAIMFDGGDKPVARVGDAVTIFWPPTLDFVGTLAGQPFTGTMTIMTPSSGVIESGAPRVTA